MKFTIFSAISATLMLSSASSAFAQSGFPDNFSTEVSGLYIGQPAAEAKSVIEEIYPNNLENVAKPEKLIGAGKTQRAGDLHETRTAKLQEPEMEFPVAYLARPVEEYISSRFLTEYRTPEGGVSVLLSSPESGSKVEAIYRRISFDTPKDQDAVMAQVAEQFGEPHATLRDAYLYSFKDGAPLDTGDDVRPHRVCASNMLRDMKVERSSTLLEPNKYLNNYFSLAWNKANQNVLDTCDASMLAAVRTNDDGLVYSITFTMLDHAAMMADMNALQAALQAAQEAIPEPQGDTNVSKF